MSRMTLGFADGSFSRESAIFFANACDLAYNDTPAEAARATYTFGAPRVGNPPFCNALVSPPLYRVVHNLDIVPLVPSRDSTPRPSSFLRTGLNQAAGPATRQRFRIRRCGDARLSRRTGKPDAGRGPAELAGNLHRAGIHVPASVVECPGLGPLHRLVHPSLEPVICPRYRGFKDRKTISSPRFFSRPTAERAAPDSKVQLEK